MTHSSSAERIGNSKTSDLDAAAALSLQAQCVYDPDDVVEVRCLNGHKVDSAWVRAVDLQLQADRLTALNRADWSIYIGANPRRCAGNGSRSSSCNGRACGRCSKCVARARCLFVDIDNVDLREARHRLDESGMPCPTLMLHSGGGVHLWWRLVEPITDLARWSRLQRGLIRILDSDPAIHDPPRIMRAAGFMNRKYPHKPVATIVDADSARQYDLCEFSDCEQATTTKPTRQRQRRRMHVANDDDEQPTIYTKDGVRFEADLAEDETVVVGHVEAVPDALRERVVNLLSSTIRGSKYRSRSERDFRACAMLARAGVDVESAWVVCRSYSKFETGGRRYFDLTWENAREDVRGEGGGMSVEDSKPTQADEIVEIGKEGDLFHGPGSDDVYATIEIDGHRETLQIQSRPYRRHLCRVFYERHKKVPRAQSLIDAMTVIAGEAEHAGREQQVYVRVAEHDGCVYVDLCDPEWRAVRIAASGWQVVDDPPVRFLRRHGMLSLPLPVEGGDIKDLRRFVNVYDDGDWALLLAWLVAALRPTGPYAALAIVGEQGCAKSTACRVLRGLIDPNAAPLRRPPRDDRDTMIAARNSWLVCFDNVSKVTPSLSDTLCSLATGGGFSTRELFTNDGEMIFNAMRPLLMNGIPNDLASRSDLADRTVVLCLPPIVDRQDEKSLWSAFDAARPRILGALFNAVAVGLRRIDDVVLDDLPRMADFARWAAACEPGLGLRPGAFVTAYSENRQAARVMSIETEPIGPSIVRLMDVRSSWTGTAGELLTALSGDAFSDEVARKDRGWPRSARALSAKLRRLAPDLRSVGVEWGPPLKTGRGRARVHTLQKMPIQPSAPSAPSATPTNPACEAANADFDAQTGGRLADANAHGRAQPSANRPPKNGLGATVNAVTDGADAKDGSKHPFIHPCDARAPDAEEGWI